MRPELQDIEKLLAGWVVAAQVTRGAHACTPDTPTRSGPWVPQSHGCRHAAAHTCIDRHATHSNTPARMQATVLLHSKQPRAAPILSCPHADTPAALTLTQHCPDASKQQHEPAGSKSGSRRVELKTSRCSCDSCCLGEGRVGVTQWRAPTGGNPAPPQLDTPLPCPRPAA